MEYIELYVKLLMYKSSELVHDLVVGLCGNCQDSRDKAFEVERVKIITINNIKHLAHSLESSDYILTFETFKN